MKKLFPDYGRDTYPSPTAGHGERIGITPFRRCQQCGTPNDTRSTAWSSQGDGLEDIENSNPIDRIASSGCRFCGSLMWLKQKPVKLPDDRDLPTPEIERNQ